MQQPQNFKQLVNIFLGIIELIIPLIFALAVLMFMWGLTRAWIMGGGNEEDVTKGKQIALWGIIVFVLMVGVWGVLAILKTTFFG